MNHFQKYSASQERKDRMRERADLAHEERLVAFTFKALGMADRSRALALRRERQTGERRLTFRDFCDEYRSFPLLLGADRLAGVSLHTDPRMFLPALFKSFHKCPFVAAYDAFAERARRLAGSRAVGLVFPRKGIPHGLVAHDGEDLPPRVFDGLVLVYRSRGGRRLFVQPYRNLLAGLYADGDGWRPE